MKNKKKGSLEDICEAYRNCERDLSRLRVDLRILKAKMENIHACRYDRVLLEPNTEDPMVNWLDRCIRKEKEIDRCIRKQKILQEKICSASSPADLPVVWLIFVEGKTVRETAGMIGVSPDTVRRKLKRAESIEF